MIVSAALAVLFFCQPKNTAEPAKPPEFRGAAVAHVHRNNLGYGSGASRELYNHLKRLGFNSVQFNTFAYQESNDSLGLSYGDRSLKGEHVRKEMELAHSLGFSVMLKPHIWVGGWNSAAEGQWRNQIDPDTPEKVDRWFADYRVYLDTQLDIALKGEAEFFVVGTELVLLSKHAQHWRDLISHIRKRNYKGKLVYACEAWNAKNIEFWDALDYVGINFYYGYEKPAGWFGITGEVSEEELITFYREKFREHYRIAKKYDRPLLVTEVGFPAHDLAVKVPYAWPEPGMAPRPELQKFAFRALRRALQREGIPAGLWFWKYVTTLKSYENRNYPTGFILQNKPAEEEIRKLFLGRGR